MVLNEDGINGRKVQLKKIFKNKNKYGGTWFSAKDAGTHFMPYAQCCTKEGLADWLFSIMGHGTAMVMIWQKGYFKNPGVGGVPRLRHKMLAWMELLPGTSADKPYEIGTSNLSRISKSKIWGAKDLMGLSRTEDTFAECVD